MTIDKHYMSIIINKLLDDIRAKEYDYACNGAKVKIALGKDETMVLLKALQDSEQVDKENGE